MFDAKFLFHHCFTPFLCMASFLEKSLSSAFCCQLQEHFPLIPVGNCPHSVTCACSTNNASVNLTVLPSLQNLVKTTAPKFQKVSKNVFHSSGPNKHKNQIVSMFTQPNQLCFSFIVLFLFIFSSPILNFVP